MVFVCLLLLTISSVCDIKGCIGVFQGWGDEDLLRLHLQDAPMLSAQDGLLGTGSSTSGTLEPYIMNFGFSCGTLVPFWFCGLEIKQNNVGT